MIETFFLFDTNIPNKSETDLLINPSIIGNCFQKLRHALRWGLENNEDALYCVCNETYQKKFNFDKLDKTINEVFSQNIFLLYIDAEFEEEININNNLSTITGITNIISFIVIKPIFEHALRILEAIPEDFSYWLPFLKSLAPHSFILNSKTTESKYQHFVQIISPFRNAGNYLLTYLDSIISQEFKNYKVWLIDDYSTDGGIEKVPDSPFLSKVINKERIYALQNILNTLLNGEFNDEDIVCLIDADDKLPHKFVFDIINNVYMDDSVLMTYGCALIIGRMEKLGNAYTEKEFDYLRKSTWKASHLRTFKYKVFKKLLNIDPTLNNLRDAQGNIIKMPYDMALLFPLMELCGFKGVKFLNTPTYEYRIHDNNDQSINFELQHLGEIEIRNKKPVI